MMVGRGVLFAMLILRDTEAKDGKHQWAKRQLSPKSSKSSKRHHNSLPENLFQLEESYPAVDAPVASPYSQSSKKGKKKAWYYSPAPIPSSRLASDETTVPTQSPKQLPASTPSISMSVPTPLPAPTLIIPTVPLATPTPPIYVMGPTIILSPSLFSPPAAPMSPAPQSGAATPSDLLFAQSTSPSSSSLESSGMGATIQPQIAVMQPSTEATAPTMPNTTMGNPSSSPLVPTKIPVNRTVTTTPPSLEEMPQENTAAPIGGLGAEPKSCTLVDGLYGSSDSDMTEDISFLYQVETTPSSPGVVHQLSQLEDVLATAMVPLIFPGACDLQRRHLEMATVVGITSSPPDLVIVDRQCEPLLDPFNACFVVDGRFRVFSNGADPPAHLVPVLNAKLRTEMAQGSFDDVAEGIVRVSTYMEPNPISTTGPSAGRPDPKSGAPNMSMISAMVGVFGTALLLLAILARRQWGIRRSQRQGEVILQAQLARP